MTHQSPRQYLKYAYRNEQLVRVKEKQRTGFPLLDLGLDIVDWIKENPEKAIAFGIILASAGVGIGIAGAFFRRD